MNTKAIEKADQYRVQVKNVASGMGTGAALGAAAADEDNSSSVSYKTKVGLFWRC